jgi:hypothetical protein
LTDIEKACELVVRNLGNLSFEEKRLVLDALKIKVLIDGDDVAIQGSIPVPVPSVATTTSA